MSKLICTGAIDGAVQWVARAEAIELGVGLKLVAALQSTDHILFRALAIVVKHLHAPQVGVRRDARLLVRGMPAAGGDVGHPGAVIEDIIDCRRVREVLFVDDLTAQSLVGLADA